MPALRDRVKVEGEVLTYPDTEPIQALQTIMEQQPSLVILERLFAATPRGAALINRIKSDPQLAHTEVRVMSHTGDYTRQVVKPTATKTPAPAAACGRSRAHASAAPVATAEAPRALDWHGTRRAPRFRVRPGVEVQLDGNPAAIVDLSTVGRTGHLADRATPEPEGPHHAAERRVSAALPRRGGLGEVRAAEVHARRRSTAPASSSRTATPPPSTRSSTATARNVLLACGRCSRRLCDQRPSASPLFAEPLRRN